MFSGGRHEVTVPGRRAPQVAAMDAVLLAELIETSLVCHRVQHARILHDQPHRAVAVEQRR